MAAKKITLSPSRDIPFDKLVLANAERYGTTAVLRKSEKGGIPLARPGGANGAASERHSRFSNACRDLAVSPRSRRRALRSGLFNCLIWPKAG
ncbi:hypothetical protein ABIE41_000418 [Bosea sp. OAE506]|uniref:hypothetical protein n=1 Tax=Bosea sp. OAE506 TaxID=2663870 RepID=UPI00178AA835